MTDDRKITMNLMQIRKIAECISHAHWHAKRKRFDTARDYVDSAEQVLKGVKQELRGGPVHEFQMQMAEFKGESVDEYVLLHDSALRALAHIELKHYVPHKAGVRVE